MANNPSIILEPVIDSPERAEYNRLTLTMDRNLASALGHQTLQRIAQGAYTAPSGRIVDLSSATETVLQAKVSIHPDMLLPECPDLLFETMRIGVRNQTSLEAAQELRSSYPSSRPLVLNFANARSPGGGFLAGARAQEECLVRSSWLYATLKGDPYYDYHRENDYIRASDWAILSPGVPVFRSDDGTPLEEPWLCDFLTCAAPVASHIHDPDESVALMKQRIDRVLAIARAYGYDALVLGAWGCGSFANDAVAVAGLFRDALLVKYQAAFRHVVFAIADWSEERSYLGPFRDTFSD